MKFQLRGSSALAVAAAAALFLAAGAGGAVAGSLITSAQIKNGTIQGIDVKAGALLGSDLKNGTVRGADVADYSLTNQDVNVLFASVQSDGTLESSSGNVTSARTATGIYTVRFLGRDIRKCAVTVQPGDVADGFDYGVSGVADLEGSVDGVFVGTKTDAGTNADKDFHLVVVC
jgi:hypothetical protein